MNRRQILQFFVGSVALAAAHPVLTACSSLADDPLLRYPTSPKEHVRSVLLRSGIARQKNGEIDKKETTYNLLDLTRRTFVHTSAQLGSTKEDEENLLYYPTKEPTILQVLAGALRGGAVVGGCHLAADFYHQVLDCVGIETKKILVNFTEKSAGPHGGILFPSIEKALLHTDLLYSERFSKQGYSIPTEHLLLPLDQVDSSKPFSSAKTIYKGVYESYLQRLPDSGVYFALQDRRKADGSITLVHLATALKDQAPKLEKMLADRVAQLGGPLQAREYLHQSLIFPHNKLGRVIY